MTVGDKIKKIRTFRGMTQKELGLAIGFEEKGADNRIARELGISKPYAYKLVREMNEELKQKGFLTIPGRVSRNYFEEKFYGLRENQ